MNSSVATSAAQMVGVYTTTGGTTTLSGANVTTGGAGAAGVEFDRGRRHQHQRRLGHDRRPGRARALCHRRWLTRQPQRLRDIRDPGRRRHRPLRDFGRRHLLDRVDNDHNGGRRLAGDRTWRLWGQRRWRGLADHARRGDDHHRRRRRIRPLRQRRGGQRDRRLDHGDRKTQRHDHQRRRDRCRAAGERGVDLGDRRRDDRLGGQRDLVHRRDQSDGDLRQFHHQQSAPATSSSPIPPSSTINFNSTTANAGTNPLLDATGAGTIATFNANASTLTGTIQTGPGATSNVNLTNGTTWNLTGPSTVSNLSVANSVIVFAPPTSGAAFKTLTVGNYVGTGANIIMNAALGGSNSGSDQIIVNGGARDRLDVSDDQERRRRRRANDRRRHPRRHHHQWRNDRPQRFRARQHAGRRRIQVLAR